MPNNKYDSIVFDVDSTLTTIEGLDFLAKIKGKEEELSKITKAAMGGDMSMRMAMEIKMKTISPSYDDLVQMGREYILNTTPGAIETIEFFKRNFIDVWILTGNFNPGVSIFADYLGIKPKNVLTNEIHFDANNNYLGFNLNNPLSNNGGKAITITKHKNKLQRTVLVGDGSTDLDTQDVVDLFIGFGGVVYRQNVKEKSDIYVMDDNLKAIIPFVIPPS